MTQIVVARDKKHENRIFMQNNAEGKFAYIIRMDGDNVIWGNRYKDTMSFSTALARQLLNSASLKYRRRHNTMSPMTAKFTKRTKRYAKIIDKIVNKVVKESS